MFEDVGEFPFYQQISYEFHNILVDADNFEDFLENDASYESITWLSQEIFAYANNDAPGGV